LVKKKVTAKRALSSDFNKTVDEAINQMMQLLSNPNKAKTFARLVFDLLKVDG
jgi:hypothetical protein